MALTFRSSIPESFTLIGVDSDGRKRVCTATKDSGEFHWNLALKHPSGMIWPGRFHGPNVLDAMSELMRSKDAEFKQDKARDDRPPAPRPDHNRRVTDGYSPVVPIPRRFT